MSDFKSLQKKRKEKFYSSFTVNKITDKEYEHVFKVWNTFQIKTMKDYHGLYLKYDVSLLTGVFEKFTNNSLKIMDYVRVII